MSGGLDRPAQHSYDPKRNGFAPVWNVDLKALWVAARSAFLLRVQAGCTGQTEATQDLAVRLPQQSNTAWPCEPCGGACNQAVVPYRHA